MQTTQQELTTPPPSLLDCESYEVTQGAVSCMELLALASEMEKSMIEAGEAPEVTLTDTILKDCKEGGAEKLEVINKRLDAVGDSKVTDRIDPYVRIFCASASRSFGDSVMWAYTLLDMAVRNPESEIGLMEFLDTFPDGIPTEESYKAIWDAQKHADAPLSNKLDLAMMWLDWATERAKEVTEATAE